MTRAVRLVHPNDFKLVLEDSTGRLALPRFVVYVGSRDATRVLGDAIERSIAMLDDLDGDAYIEDDEASNRIFYDEALPPYLYVDDADCKPDDLEITDWAAHAECSTINAA